MKNLLVILGILVLLFEIYHLLRGYWIRRLLEKQKKPKQPRKPPVMRPKSERDRPVCQKEHGKRLLPKREMPVS